MSPETFARKGQFGQWSGDSGWLARVWRDKGMYLQVLT